jgi:hypothetical protein
MAEEPTTVTPGPGGPAPKFLGLPRTKLGWWSVGLAAAFVVMFIVNVAVFGPSSGGDTAWRNVLLPVFAIGMLTIGVAAGVVALVAVIQKRERSWLVFLPLLPAAFVIFFLLGEFLTPH